MTQSGRQRNLMMHAQCPLPVFILSGLMHLTAEGRSPEAVRCIRPPEALSFPTQPPGDVLMAILNHVAIVHCTCTIKTLLFVIGIMIRH